MPIQDFFVKIAEDLTAGVNRAAIGTKNQARAVHAEFVFAMGLDAGAVAKAQALHWRPLALTAGGKTLAVGGKAHPVDGGTAASPQRVPSVLCQPSICFFSALMGALSLGRNSSAWTR